MLDGEQEAKVIALRLGEPPEGFANWSLRLLAEKVVELGIVESVSHETLRKTLRMALFWMQKKWIGIPGRKQAAPRLEAFTH